MAYAGKKERRDAEENREHILRTAGALFDELGVEAVSMHQIAKAAGVGQGTLYRKYANKGDLCRDLKNENFRRFLDGLREELAAAKASPLRSRLRLFLERTVAFIDEQAAWLEVLQQLPPVSDGTCLSMYQTSNYQELHGILRQLLAECPDRSGKRPDPVVLADALLAPLQPKLFRFLRDDRNLSSGELLDNLFRIYLEPQLPE